MTKISKSNKHIKTLSALIAVFVIAVFVGIFSFADIIGAADNVTYEITDAQFKSGVVAYDDLDAETVKTILTVKGRISGSGDEPTVLDGALYKARINGSDDGKFSADDGAVNTVQVSADDGANWIAITGDLTVKAAEIQNVAIGADGYELQGSFFVNEKGYYAFTQGMTKSQVEAVLRVTLYYPNHTETLSFADGVSWAQGFVAPEVFGDADADADANISLSLAVDGYDSVVTQSVAFRKLEAIGMRLLDGWTQPDGLTSTTLVSSFVASLSGKVIYVMNNGADGAIVEYTDLQDTIIGPTPEALIRNDEQFVYNKKIQITNKDSSLTPLDLNLTNITYKKPSTMPSEISGQMTAQSARTEKENLNYNGLYLQMRYQVGLGKVDYNINLTDFIAAGYPITDIKYYVEDGTKTTEILTREVVGISFSCCDYEFMGNVVVQPILQARPVIVGADNEEGLDLTDDCKTQIEGLVNYEDDANHDYMEVKFEGSNAQYAFFDAATKTVKFERGGEYTIVISFAKGDNSDFSWSLSNGGGNFENDDYSKVVYTVLVNKAEITVELNNLESSYQYGQNEPPFSITGGVEGSAKMRFDNLTDGRKTDGVISEDLNRTDKPEWRLVYSGTLKAGGTYSDSYNFPTELGDYKVKVETAATSWYLNGESQLYSFSIVERRIALEAITIPSYTYDRAKSYTINGSADTEKLIDGITVNGLLSEKGDTVSNVMKLTFEDVEVAHHAKSYVIDFEIVNKNYIWAESAGADEKGVVKKSFEITPRKVDLQNMSLGLAGNTYVYGKLVTLAPTVDLYDQNVKVEKTDFYPVLDDIKYYKVENGVETLMENEDFYAWQVGSYVARYTTSVNSDDLETDYDQLPTAQVSFSVTRRPLAAPQFIGGNATYNGQQHTFSVSNWQAITQEFKNGDVPAAITVTGTVSSGQSAARTTVTDGTITVIDAAQYTVSVTIDAAGLVNYKWADTDGAVKSQSYTISPETLSIKLSTEEFPYNGEAHVPEVSATNESLKISDELTLSVAFTQTYKNSLGDILNADKVTDADTYAVTLSNPTISTTVAGAAYTYAVNYVLPSSPEYAFVISTPELVKPSSFKQYSVEYNGGEYILVEYLEGDYVNTISGNKVVFTVDGQTVTSLKTAKTYTVLVKPTGNYVWQDKTTDAVPLTFSIEPRAIIVDWRSSSLSSVYGSNPSPAIESSNIVSGDAVSITIGYKKDGAVINDLTSTSDAGKYSVYVKDLTGGDCGNYKIADNDYTTEYLITKRELEKPNQEDHKVLTGEYVASAWTGYVADWNYGLTSALVSATVTGQRPNSWYANGGESADRTIDTTSESVKANYYLNVENGAVSVMEAGDYFVSFSIVDRTNYCWKSSGATTDYDNTMSAAYEHSWEKVFVQIARKTLDAPQLGAKRAMEQTEATSFAFNLASYNLDVTAVYGKTTDMTVSVNQTDIDGTTAEKGTTAQRGSYYILLTIGKDALNYQWTVKPDNGDGGYLGSDFVDDIYEEIYTQEYGAQIKLFYSITASQVSIRIDVTNYTYGDNADYIGGNSNTGKIDLNDVFKLTASFDNATWANDGSIQYAFYYYVDGVRTKVTDLYNDLPANAGTYEVEIEITFDTIGGEKVYQEWHNRNNPATLVVSPRPLQVKWKLAGQEYLDVSANAKQTVTYNGEQWEPKAIVTNLCHQEKQSAENLELTYNYKKGGFPVNAQENAYVISVEGGFGQNYVLTGTTSFELTIQRKTVAVCATPVTNYVYGESVNVSDCWTGKEDFCGDDAKMMAAVVLQAGKICGTSVDNMPTVGQSYLVCPVWTNDWQSVTVVDNKYQITTTNYQISVTAAEFTVNARRITVTFTADGSSSDYSQAVNLYGIGNLYEIALADDLLANKDALVNNDASQVIALTIKDAQGKDVTDADSSLWAAGVYAVTAEGKNQNYQVTVANSGKHTVNNAEITIASIKGYVGEYDGEERDMFEFEYETKNNQTVVWSYKAADSETWLPLNGKKVKYVEDSGLYNIKADAANHNTAYYNVSGTSNLAQVKVEITPRMLNVSVNLTIKYGEKSPYFGDGNAYKATVDELKKANTAQSIYTVTGLAVGDTMDGIGLDGSFHYTTDYTQGDPVSDAAHKYALTFVCGGLTADNYVFTDAGGTLTVDKLNLVITLTGVETTYGTGYSLSLFKNHVTVTLPNSTYTGNPLTQDETSVWNTIYGTSDTTYVGANIIGITTGAYTANSSAGVTRNVAAYTYTATLTQTANYSADAVSATHSITAATLEMLPNNIKGIQAVYTEQPRDLLTKADDGKITGGSDYAESKNGMTVYVVYYVVDKTEGYVYLTNTQLAAITAWTGEMPTTTDACSKVVYYRVTADNHNDAYAWQDAVVTQAENGFAQDFEIGAIGWDYGVRKGVLSNGTDDNVTDGKAKFTKLYGKDKSAEQNAFTVELTKNGSVLLSGSSAEELFKQAWIAGTFQAGEYTLRVYMQGNPNYKDLEKTWVITVSKATLIIQAQAQSVTYGEAVKGNGTVLYHYTASGFTRNKAGAENETEEQILGLNNQYFSSDYSVGSYVREGGYAIIANAGNPTVTECGNYTINYTGAVLTVNKREVTVSIGDRSNIYNLQTPTGQKEQVDKLTFTVTKGSFYGIDSEETYDNDNQSVIKLRTLAIPEYGVDSMAALTNNVIVVKRDIYGRVESTGAYPIYAVYGTYEDGTSYGQNYVVSFAQATANANTYADELKNVDGKPQIIVENDAVITGGAGSYRILQATLDITDDGVWYDKDGTAVQSQAYTGTAHYYKVIVNNADDQIKITFDYSYSKTGISGAFSDISADDVINAGYYVAYGKFNSDNYQATTMNYRFEITKATIVLSAKDTYVEYGTVLTGNPTSVNNRFGGFEYEYSQGTLTDGVYADYIEKHPVTYTTSNYYATAAGDHVVTQSGHSANIYPKCDSDDNVNVICNPGTLTVTKRNVTVTVAGYPDNDAAQCDYQGSQDGTQAALNAAYQKNMTKFLLLEESETFGASGDDRSKLGIAFSLPNDSFNVVDGGYRMNVSGSDQTNYNVKFKTSDSSDLYARIDASNENAPVFMVNRAKVTIYANSMVNDGTPYGYTITYGDEISSITLSYSVVGLKGSDSLAMLAGGMSKITYSQTLKGGNDPYAAWKSAVGQTYLVSVNKLSNEYAQNYDLANSEYVTAELTITPRAVNVSTANRTYEKAADGYHGGVYGAALEAQLTFTDVKSNSTNVNKNINGEYKPATSLTYSTVAGEGQTAGTAPVKVGDYTVAVTLTGNNYTLEDGTKQTILNYSVTKRTIYEGNLVWNQNRISAQEEKTLYVNFIDAYVNDIMDVMLFTFAANGETGTRTIVFGNENTPNTYYFNQGKLYVTADGVGRYEARIQLKSSALSNYAFESSNDTLIISAFTVTTAKLVMELSVSGWVYNTTPNEPNVTVNGSQATDARITYAKVIGSVDKYLGAQFDSIVGLENDGLRSVSAITFDVGYYVVCAKCVGVVVDENGQEKSEEITQYYVFEITPAKVSAPTAQSGGYTFNGREQSLEILYDSTLMRASYSGHTGTSSGGIIAYASNAGDYTVEFSLINYGNYVWADGVETDEDNVYAFVWSIAMDNTENGVDDDVVLTVASENVATFGSVSMSAATVKQGYVGDITTAFAADEGSADPSQITDWQNGLPSQNVGDYYVKLTLSDGNVNYSDKVTYAKLRVVPKEITVTASGSIIYGDALSTLRATYNVEGLLYGDQAAQTEGFEYVLADNYGKLLADGEYYVTVKSDTNGVAIGLSAGDNYVIKAVQGRLTVNRRNLTVTIGNATAQYGLTPDLSKVNVECRNLIDGDDIGLKLVTTATADSNKGGYAIRAEYDNDNYNVTVVEGIYTVTERRITVEIIAGGGIYDDTIMPVYCGKVTDEQGADISDFAKNKITLKVEYSGISYDGKVYDNVTIRPDRAGVYLATVRGSDNENFLVVGQPFTTYVIEKKELDAGKLVIPNATYTGNPVRLVINASNFEELYGQDLYNIVHNSQQFVNAGVYNITLHLTDEYNYKWKSADINEITVQFTIDKATNDLTEDLQISGWSYGDYNESVNAPRAAVKFGQDSIQFVYSSAENGEYVAGIPSNGEVGDYYVKARVAETDNYLPFESQPVKFSIAKKALAVPSLTVVTDGEGKNDVYSGGELLSVIVGFDMALMNLDYEGKFNVSGGQVTVVAVNAGVYTVTVSVATPKNYRWQNVDGDKVELVWTVSPKSVDKPVENTSQFMVNGQILTYVPQGYDEQTMTLSGNQTAYGGQFAVTVGLADKANYVWSDGTTDDFELTWNVAGINDVFKIIAAVLGGASGAALIAAGVQLLLDRRRKKAIDLAIERRSQQEEKTTDEGGNE